MPDTIFETGAPLELKGRLFHYTVTGYNSIWKEFELTYQKFHIATDGNMWTVDVDAKEEEVARGNPSTISNAKYDLVYQGSCLMTRAHIRIAAGEDQEKELAKEDLVIAKEFVDLLDTNASDLHCAACTNPRGWFGESCIECLFSLTRVTG